MTVTHLPGVLGNLVYLGMYARADRKTQWMICSNRRKRPIPLPSGSEVASAPATPIPTDSLMVGAEAAKVEPECREKTTCGRGETFRRETAGFKRAISGPSC